MQRTARRLGFRIAGRWVHLLGPARRRGLPSDPGGKPMTSRKKGMKIIAGAGVGAAAAAALRRRWAGRAQAGARSAGAGKPRGALPGAPGLRGAHRHHQQRGPFAPRPGPLRRLPRLPRGDLPAPPPEPGTRSGRRALPALHLGWGRPRSAGGAADGAHGRGRDRTGDRGQLGPSPSPASATRSSSGAGARSTTSARSSPSSRWWRTCWPRAFAPT